MFREYNRAELNQNSAGATLEVEVPMKNILLLVLLFVTAGFGQTNIPDTPAGEALRMWLDAFNSADRARLEAYVKNVQPTESVDHMLALRNQTGGFDLLSVESPGPLLIKFRVKEKVSAADFPWAPSK